MLAEKRALIVVTSTEKYPKLERATGLWLGEAVHFYDVLHKAGWHIDFCSPRGGYTPIDPVSVQVGVLPIDWHYYADPHFRHLLATTIKASDVNPDHYSVVYYAGGHGTVFDFYDDKHLQQISRRVYEKGGILSSVCHGATAFINQKLSDGKYLVDGKQMTGFSNKEEVMAQLDKQVPHSLEDELVKKGAKYESGEPFKPFAVTCGRLITGQNPQSGKEVGEHVLAALKK